MFLTPLCPHCIVIASFLYCHPKGSCVLFSAASQYKGLIRSWVIISGHPREKGRFHQETRTIGNLLTGFAQTTGQLSELRHVVLSTKQEGYLQGGFHLRGYLLRPRCFGDNWLIITLSLSNVSYTKPEVSQTINFDIFKLWCYINLPMIMYFYISNLFIWENFLYEPIRKDKALLH